ncbi:MAG: SEC59/DGK1/VTE5 family protein [Candidatus Thermoplasmatota archaeon]|nr:SEC59/DGK1/VTE5 family protein [Candidatus Thermoplasmatota archaeon]
MLYGDILGLVLVYGYVFSLIIVSEFFLKKRPVIARKFLHIMVGNIFLILPFFETRWAMALLAAFPFVILTFLMSPRSPIKSLASRTSAAGHGYGLVYYSISWTLLALLFFEHKEIIAIGIVAMSYGDGLASIIGLRYCMNNYNICGDKKSVEGSIAMFFVITLLSIPVLAYYGFLDLLGSQQHLPLLFVLPVVAAMATIMEASTPRGLDNLSVSLSASLTFYLLFYGGIAFSGGIL